MSDLQLTWYGTAGIKLSYEGREIIFDPFVPFKHSEIPVALSDFDGVEEIFITHGHFDHIGSLAKIYNRNPGIKIYCTKTPFKTLVKRGIPRENLIMVDYGQELFVNGFSIKTFHGKHAVLPSVGGERIKYLLKSPARGNIFHLLIEHKNSPENGETLFYQVEVGGLKLGIMGSLNLLEDEEYPTGADILVLPYNGWDDNFPPAMEVIKRLRPKKVLLDHYDDSFPPLTMPLDLSPVLENSPVETIPLRHKIPVTITDRD